MRYLQIASDNTITDCIDNAYAGYIKFEGEVPQSVNGGWHKLINGVIVEQIELNPNTIQNQIQSAIDDYTLSLIEGGLL